MNKSELIEEMAERFEGNRKQAAYALEAVLDTIARELARGEKVAITGFGSFERRIREARWVRNPRTGEKIQSKETAVPKFKPGADLKAVVSGAKQLPALVKDSVSEAADRVAAAPAKAADAVKNIAGRAGAQAEDGPVKDAADRVAETAEQVQKKADEATGAAADKTPAKKTPAKKATKAPAKKASPTTAKKAPAKKAPVKKAPAAKAPAKKAASTTAKKSPAADTAQTPTPAKKAAKTTAKKAPATKAPAKKATAKKSPAPTAASTTKAPSTSPAEPATPSPAESATTASETSGETGASPSES